MCQTQISNNQALRSINLQQNNLSRLFYSPHEIPPCTHIESIDLRENQLYDLLYTLNQEILPIFPNLRDLKLNLYDEDHVDFIIKNMPQLEFLNGLPVEREDEEEDYNSAAPSRRERTGSSDFQHPE